MATKIFVGLCLLLHTSVLGLRVASSSRGKENVPEDPQELLAIDAESSCPATVFAYFKPSAAKMFFAASDAEGSKFTEVNDHKPIPLDMAEGTSLRDPFIKKDLKGKYRLVGTNGAGFGNTDSILMWHSDDLQTWSKQKVAAVMEPMKDDLEYTWAPEWVHLKPTDDGQESQYLIFWATKWKDGHANGKFSEACDNKADNRFSFWGVTTKDWNEFSEPRRVLDPHCKKADFAGMNHGGGGIDGTMHYDEKTKTYYMFYKDSRSPETTGLQELQKTSGIRMMSTKTPLKPETWYQPVWSKKGDLVGPWGTEGPELLVVGDEVRLYFDCSFQPNLKDGSKPPYGKATANLADVFQSTGESPPKWNVAEGSCTGRGNKLKFPKDATHGGFVCVSNAKAQQIEAAKWQ